MCLHGAGNVYLICPRWEKIPSRPSARIFIYLHTYLLSLWNHLLACRCVYKNMNSLIYMHCAKKKLLPKCAEKTHFHILHFSITYLFV